MRISRIARLLPATVLLSLLLTWPALAPGCAASSGPDLHVDDQQANRTQRLLKQHNAGFPLTKTPECLEELQKLLANITGVEYVFTEFAPERWETGGKAALFVPLHSRFGRRSQTVTVVVDDSCRIQGLIWPE